MNRAKWLILVGIGILAIALVLAPEINSRLTTVLIVAVVGFVVLFGRAMTARSKNDSPS